MVGVVGEQEKGEMGLVCNIRLFLILIKKTETTTLINLKLRPYRLNSEVVIFLTV